MTESAARTAPEAQEAHVWFLRGINVGGAHSVRMSALRDHLGELGAAEVRTYIRSGNVAFRASTAAAAAIQSGFEDEASDRYGFRIPVVARTGDELAGIVSANPFLAGVDPHGLVDHTRYHLGLLREDLPAEMPAALGAGAWSPDDCAVLGRDVYFHLPNGVAASTLLQSKAFAKLWGGMTLRNWRTVQRTLALTREGRP